MPTLTATILAEPVTVHALPGPEDLAAFVKFLDSDAVLGLDVETTAITDSGVFNPDARLRLVQLGNKHESWVLDPNSNLGITWLVSAFSSDHRFVTHTNYDVLWIRRELGINLHSHGIDSYTLACTLEPGERNDHSLKGLCTRHIDDGLQAAEEALTAEFKRLAPTGERVGRKLQRWGFTNIPLDNPIYLLYAGLDSIYVRRLLDIFTSLFANEEADFRKLSKREQELQRIVNETQWHGLVLDREYTQGLLRDIENEYLGADARLQKIFGFSSRSPKRGDWLAERGVKFTKLTKTGRPRLDKNTLPILAVKYRRHVTGPVIADMITLSSQQNLFNNLRGILAAADPNGVVHPRIKTLAAVTGRMSIVDPAMQTFKKEDKRLRRCFRARPGMVLIGADYDSQEVRLAAAFSQDPALLRIVLENRNQHDETARMIFGDKYTDHERHVAKTLDFAQQYGAGPKTISGQLGISYREAKKRWTQWREAYEGLVGWSFDLEDQAVVVNPWGRRIPRDVNRPYANGNYMIQSSGRDVLGDAIIRLKEVGLADSLWLPIHDELILEVPEQEAESSRLALAEAMRCTFRGIELTASAEIIGHRWGGDIETEEVAA